VSSAAATAHPRSLWDARLKSRYLDVLSCDASTLLDPQTFGVATSTVAGKLIIAYAVALVAKPLELHHKCLSRNQVLLP